MKLLRLVTLLHCTLLLDVSLAVDPAPPVGNAPAVSLPRIVSDYVTVYKPEGNVFPGPDAANLVAGKFYEDWVPNDHCFVRDDSGRWHVFGITHPLTNFDKIHAGEHALFHATAPPGLLQETLKDGGWKDQPLILPPSERPGELAAIHAPTIIRGNDMFQMVYGPTPIRYAVSKELQEWRPHGAMGNTPEGRDPNILPLSDGMYHLIVCGLHEVRAATSHDLQTWTKSTPILQMKEGVDPESPSLVRWNNTYYLFVCGWNGEWDRKELQGAYQHKTYVYQSDDPMNFDGTKEIAVLDAHAPEIFQDEAGDWYISSVEWPRRGVSIAKLAWDGLAAGK